MTAAQPSTVDSAVGGAELIVADGLHRSFGSTPALAGASLALRAGEVLAVMGPSGSGKSTLLHCLAGILVPDAGTVRYNGLGALLLRAAGQAVHLDWLTMGVLAGSAVGAVLAITALTLPSLRSATRPESLRTE